MTRMFRSRAAAAIAFASLMTAAAVFGQSAEYGRTSGGEIKGIAKRPSTFSGSLGLGFSTGSGRNLLASGGGTLLKDRLWFFGSAEINQQRPQFLMNTGRAAPVMTFGDMTARISDKQMFTTSANRGANFGILPSSFLTLHYTGIVSSNMFFTASVSQSSSRLTP